MNERRDSTSSPIRIEKISSACGGVVEGDLAAGSRVAGPSWSPTAPWRSSRRDPCSAGSPFSFGSCLPAATAVARAARRARGRSRRNSCSAACVHLQPVERRLRQVDVAGLDERPHEAEQQRQQQGRDVLAVDVGVGHQHDLVVPQPSSMSNSSPMPVPNAEIIACTSLLPSALVDARLLDVQDLAAHRQDRLDPRVATLHAPSRRPSRPRR